MDDSQPHNVWLVDLAETLEDKVGYWRLMTTEEALEIAARLREIAGAITIV